MVCDGDLNYINIKICVRLLLSNIGLYCLGNNILAENLGTLQDAHHQLVGF